MPFVMLRAAGAGIEACKRQSARYGCIYGRRAVIYQRCRLIFNTYFRFRDLQCPKIVGTKMESDVGFQAALEEARMGASEGGVPVGAALVSADGKILGRGHNMRVQKGSATLHVCEYQLISQQTYIRPMDV